MANIMSGLTFTVLFSLLLRVTANTVSLPVVTGDYNVGTIDLELSDYSRVNPFAPDPSAPGPRSFMISLFYPAKNVKKYPFAPYMPPKTAALFEGVYSLPNGTLSSFIQPNSHIGAPIRPCDETQAILFSPGFGISRKFYTTLAEDLASHGYLVVTIDHPYDAPIVEFPDGSIILGDPTMNLTNPDDLAKLFDLRIKDTLFTLDMLHKNITKNIPGVRKRLSIKETGMFGHSFGGATTAESMFLDDRICAGVNMDGFLAGDVVEKGLEKPLVLMGTPLHNLTSDSSWETFWGTHRGWKRILVLEDARHLTYSDYPVLVEILGLRDVLPPDDVDLFVGTINGLRANEIQRAYIDTFFDFALRGKKDTLFDGPDSRYPEVIFQN